MSKTNTLPLSFKPYLWSYDFEKLDKEKNKTTIIQSLLEFGKLEDTKKMFKIYTKTEIKNVLKKMRPNPFDKKSLNYWKLMLDLE